MALRRPSYAREELDSEEESCLSDSEENLVPPKRERRRGRQAQWQDSHVARGHCYLLPTLFFSRQKLILFVVNTLMADVRENVVLFNRSYRLCS